MSLKPSSRWTTLPKSVIDLIYSFDSSYHEYMTNIVLKKPFEVITRYQSESAFYHSVMQKRYHQHNANLLLILHERTSYKKFPAYPLWSDIEIVCNYTMRTRANLCSNHRIIRKQIFKYHKKFHWFISIQTEITLPLFLSKFLCSHYIDYMAFSDICLFNDLSETTNSLVSDTTGKKLRRNLKWFDDKEYTLAVITDFDIIVENHIIEMDVLKIFSFQDRIYMCIEFDHNRTSHYSYNKSVYDMLIYYINMRLRMGET